eukprot:COSAG02_NODE_365_length_23749_cov_13.908584_4_plen_53_part_00
MCFLTGPRVQLPAPARARVRACSPIRNLRQKRAGDQTLHNLPRLSQRITIRS